MVSEGHSTPRQPESGRATTDRNDEGLETTPCHFGGHRVWSTCRGCQRRRAVLFSVGGAVQCRGCHDLSYRRIRTLQQWLGEGGYGAPVWVISAKATHMHWHTHARLVGDLQTEHALNGVLFTEGLRRLAERLDRLKADQ